MCWSNFSTSILFFLQHQPSLISLFALFHLFSFISTSYSCHILHFICYSVKLVLKCLSITLLSYVSLPSLVSLGIRHAWVESKVNRFCLNPSRRPSSSPLPEQTLKLLKRLILFTRRGQHHVSGFVSVTDPLTVASVCSSLALLLIDTVQRKNKQSVTNPDYCL